MAKPSPVQLTRIWWEDYQRAIIDVVERHIRSGRRTITKDLFGCFDLSALCRIYRTAVHIQVTSSTNHAARRKKVLDSDAYRFMVENEVDVLLSVHSWHYRKGDDLWVGRWQGWDKDTILDSPLEMRSSIKVTTEKGEDGKRLTHYEARSL